MASELADSNSYEDFDHIFLYQLDKHAPQKNIWIRSTTKPHVNKKLRSTIMQKSRLKNKVNKTKSWQKEIDDHGFVGTILN